MYCQKVVGDANFSINEWNEQYELCNKLDIDMPDEYQDEPCKEQCFDCLAIVGKRQEETKKLLKQSK